jgi:hypothetical protein
MYNIAHCFGWWLAVLALALLGVPVTAQEAVQIGERLTAGAQHRISVRVELAGTLTLPPEKGATPRQLIVKGRSSIDYDERLLTLDKLRKVQKTFRVYRHMDFERKVGDQLQQGSLRPSVHRLVILRHNQMEVPFSPDGPLTWGEIDLVRTDVFTPALTGLFPDRAVRPGDRWAASTSAILELTDFEQIDDGTVACKLDQLTILNGRRHARVSFSGIIRGLGEDGPGRQQLDGYYYFDLGGGYLSYLSMKGTHSLLDKDGKVAGQVEGNFVLTRQPLANTAPLSDAVLSKLTLEPNENNTLLLFDDPDLGVRLLYPRRWHVAGGKGRQLGLDEQGGSGILLTVEPLATTPTGPQFLEESRQWLVKQKATIQRVEPVRVIQQSPRIENFALDVTQGGRQFRMYYLVIRQAEGGVVVAGRLQFKDLANLQREVLRVATSIQLTRKQ